MNVQFKDVAPFQIQGRLALLRTGTGRVGGWEKLLATSRIMIIIVVLVHEEVEGGLYMEQKCPIGKVHTRTRTTSCQANPTTKMFPSTE